MVPKMRHVMSSLILLSVFCLLPAASYAEDATLEGRKTKLPKKSGIDFTMKGLGSALYIPRQERSFDAPITGLYRANVEDGRFRPLKIKGRRKPSTAEFEVGEYEFFYCSSSRAVLCTLDGKRVAKNSLRRVKNLSLALGPNNNADGVQNITALNGNYLFLTLRRDNYGIMQLDGELTNPTTLGSTTADSDSDSVEFFTKGNHTFFIQGPDFDTLVVSDGTAEGTRAVEGWDGINGYEPNFLHFEPESGRYFFPAYTVGENFFFDSNLFSTSSQFERPTPAVENFSSVDSITSIEQLAGSTDLYITGRSRETSTSDLEHGFYKIDTTANTMSVILDLSDTTSTQYGYSSSKLVQLNGSIFFLANRTNDPTTIALWKSDGTSAGTQELRTFSTQDTGGNSGSLDFTRLRPRIEVINNKLLIFIHHPTVANETAIWISDGESASATALTRDGGQDNFLLKKSVTRPSPAHYFSGNTLVIDHKKHIYRYTID